MDKALWLLDRANKLKTPVFWKPTLHSLAMRHHLPLPPQESIDLQRLNFNAHTIVHILPFLDGPLFDEYMLQLGAYLWKAAEQEHLSLSVAKEVVLAVLQRPKLDNLLMAYLTLWDEDRHHFPHHLYSLGLGRLLRLTHSNLESKILFYKQMSPNEYVLMNPIFPHLRHVHNYSYSPEEFSTVTHHLEKKPMLPQANIPPKNLFYVKMTFIAVRANQHRWPEVWAQAMSAMDLFQCSFESYHDLMCYVALSAGMLSLSESIVFRALDEARLFSCEVEHVWQRLVVLHALSIHWGYFDLEQDMFEFGQELIPRKTEYHNKLLRQHMDSLMRQCENIELYLKARRKYHEKCTSATRPTECNLSIIYDYSYLKKNDLLQQMETLLPQLDLPGDKEYYQGIIHHYQTHKDTIDTEVIDILHRQIGTKLLSVASKLMKPLDVRSFQCHLLHKATDLGSYDVETIMKSLEQYQLTKWSPEIADLWVQLAIFSMTYNNSQFMGGARILQNTIQAYRRATHNLGYRKYILQAAQRLHQESGFHHIHHKDLPDYPLAEECFGQDHRQEHRQGSLAKWFWRQEKESIYAKMQQVLEQYHPLMPAHDPTPLLAAANDHNYHLPEQQQHVQDCDEGIPYVIAVSAAGGSEVQRDTEEEEEQEEEEEEEEEEAGEVREAQDEDEEEETDDAEEEEENQADQEPEVAAAAAASSCNTFMQFVEPTAGSTKEGADTEAMDIDLSAGPSPTKKSRIFQPTQELLASRDFLELDPKAEELYAFGCFLIQLLAE